MVRYPFNGAYTAHGYRSQNITVIPELQMVVAHKADPRVKSTSWNSYLGLLSPLIALG